MHIVLYHPEIPQNTGNIARTCAATGTTLNLIEPFGFSLSDRYLKRAGLDYWPLLDIHVFPDFDALLAKRPDARFFFTTTKADRTYTDIQYDKNDHLVFGPETVGLPESLLSIAAQHTIRIPMLDTARSLNLSNSVAIVLYEALRQQGFEHLNSHGHLTGREDGVENWMHHLHTKG